MRDDGNKGLLIFKGECMRNRLNCWGDFFKLIVKMREAEKNFSKTRYVEDLRKAERLQKEADEAIQKIKKIREEAEKRSFEWEK